VERTPLLELRQQRMHQQDINFADVCHKKQLLTRPIQIRFASPDSEPLLWAADWICGAALAAKRGQSDYLEMLEDTIVPIPTDAK
jgi:hypothetical protein